MNINNDKLLKNVKVLHDRAEIGLEGKYKVNLNEIIMVITNKCNGMCIMCPNLILDSVNQTYLNASPWSLSFKEYKKKYLSSPRMLPRFLWPNKQFYESNVTIRFDQGESFLNKDFHKILKYTKRTLPNSTTVLLTSGSIYPENFEIVKNLSILSFSIDGCTAETFEKIRTTFKFDKVVNLMKAFIAAKRKYKSDTILRMSVCLSGMNVHELGGIIRLAKEIGEFESVYTNPLMIMEHMPEKQKEFLRPHQLENLDYDYVHKHIVEAFQASEETGIRLDAPDEVRKYLNPKTPSIFNDSVSEDASRYDTSLHKYCTKPWHGIVKYDEEGKFSRWCGNIALEPSLEIIEKYNIPRIGTPWEILNSEGFFQYRKDSLDGKLLKYCEGCRVGSFWVNELAQNDVVPERWVTS
ncbi:MAG: hypothetical protein FWD87_03515 [Spirochaetaceae bacterium]|nr:hypothetical protein [Spirochaetaceae bacterium]